MLLGGADTASAVGVSEHKLSTVGSEDSTLGTVPQASSKAASYVKTDEWIELVFGV